MRVLGTFLVCSSLWAGTMSAWAADRVALVLGNANYRSGSTLINPLNDARDTSVVLADFGFDVTTLLDQDLAAMEGAVTQFGRQLTTAQVGVFYYAGHGVQVDNENYLLPVDLDANLSAGRQLRYKALALGFVLAAMEAAGPKLNIVILDACRDNPFRGLRSVGRGLARQDSPTSTLLAYATAPGQVAEDGSGRNGTYTHHLLAHLRQHAGLAVTELFNRVAWSVKQSTHGQQDPWLAYSALPPFCFASCGQSQSNSTNTPNRVRLAVKPTPADARVRIMNIVPTYRDGIELKPGRYDLEVSLAGYETYRKWHELAAGEQVLNIELRQSVTSVASTLMARPATADSGKVIRDQLRTGGNGPAMVLIRGGCYLMGSPVSEAGRINDETHHRVCVDDFYIGKYEVTFAEYDRFAETTNQIEPNDHGWGRGNQPVVNISWQDANAYLKWLSGETGNVYRLPTEAEWEYAARGGTQTTYWWGVAIDRNRANCRGCASQWDGRQPAPVASFSANDFGLHDTVGNVWEWTCSEYLRNYEGQESRCVGETNNVPRVLRGGSWRDRPLLVRSAYRGGNIAGIRGDTLGFRPVRLP